MNGGCRADPVGVVKYSTKVYSNNTKKVFEYYFEWVLFENGIRIRILFERNSCEEIPDLKNFSFINITEGEIGI